MDETLKARVVAALRTADRQARNGEDQREFRDLVYLLTVPTAEEVNDAPLAADSKFTADQPVSVAAHDELRTSVQESTKKAEAAVYSKVNAPSKD